MRLFSHFARMFVLMSILGLLIFLLMGCSTSVNGTSATSPTKKAPAAPAGQITEFPLPASTANSFPIAITGGPDGNLWFTEWKLGQDQSQKDQSLIWRVTPAGKVNEFPLLTTNTIPTGITKGPDGNL